MYEYIRENKFSLIYLCLYSMLFLLMPYFRGLFFDQDMYLFELLLGVLFLLVLSTYNRQKTTTIFQSLTACSLLLIVLFYFISAFLSQSPLMAYQEAFRWLIYALSFIGLIKLLDKRLNKITIHIIFLSILWVGLFGLLAQFGIVHFKDAIIGTEIASVLQYANTLAAIVAALIIGILLYGTNLRVRWYIRFAYFIFLPSLMIVFFYTQSRATWLMFPLAWLIGLGFIGFKQQVQYLLSTIVLILFTIPVLINYEPFLAAQNKIMLFLLLLLGIVFATVAIGLNKLLEKKNWSFRSPYQRLIIPILIIVIGLSGFVAVTTPFILEKMPEAIQSRFQDINLETKSVTERGAFYQDSWLLFKENWLIGTGGNGWRALFMTVQSLPYYSTQTHSFAMKLLVEVGLLGTIAFLAFMGILLFTIYRWVKRYGFQNERMLNVGIPFTMALMLFIHSLVDFDMSYGYFALLWFTLLAMVYVEVREEDTEIKINCPILANVTMWGTVAVSAFALIFIARFAYAETIPVNNLPVDQAVANVEKKIKLNPVNTDFRFQKMLVMEVIAEKTNNPEAIKAGLQEGLKIAEIDRHNPQSLIKVAQYFAKHGYGMDALKLSKQALDQAPWFLDAYEQYFAFASPASMHLIKEGNGAEAKKYIEDISQRITELEEKRKYLDTMPESLRYPEFQLTEIIRRYGGQALVLNGEYDRAVQVLSPLTGSQAPEVKEDALLWLSIAYEKTGKQQETEQMMQEGRQLDSSFDQKREEVLALVEKYRGQ